MVLYLGMMSLEILGWKRCLADSQIQNSQNVSLASGIPPNSDFGISMGFQFRIQNKVENFQVPCLKSVEKIEISETE